MTVLKKKAKFCDYDGNVLAKYPVDAWVIRPGKQGSKTAAPGVAILVETDFEYVEITLQRSELLDLLDDMEEKFPGYDGGFPPAQEPCDCVGCVPAGECYCGVPGCTLDLL